MTDDVVFVLVLPRSGRLVLAAACAGVDGLRLLPAR